MNPVERVLSALETRGLSVRGNVDRGWTAQCPAHDDRNASLSIGIGGDGKALLHCHANCSIEEIVSTIGLEKRDLFPVHESSLERQAAPRERSTVKAPAPLPTGEQLAAWGQRLIDDRGLLDRLRELRGWSRDAIAELGVGWDARANRVVLPIRGSGGELLNTCCWTPSPKHGEPKMRALAGRRRDLFPAPEALEGEEVWIVEGEPDAVTAASLGLPAVGIPGVEFAGRRLDVERFRRFRRVNVLLDCDRQGREAAGQIATVLADSGIDAYVLDLDASRDDGYDLGEWAREAAQQGAEGLASAARILKRMAAEATPRATDWPAVSMCALPPFPGDALPAPVAAWVSATAEHTQTPADLPALAALGVLSGAALGGAVVDCGAWEEELGLYLLPAMPSGDRKSTVLRAATQPLREFERQRADLAAPRIRELRSRGEVLEIRARNLTKLAAKENIEITERLEAEQELARVGAELEEIGQPAIPRLLADDATPEALAGLLSKHGSIAVLAAESALIDNLAGRYSDGRANLHLVCAAYSGEPTTIDRKGNDPERLDRPLLAIALVVQPHVLEALVAHPTARAQGLVARFAYALPETRLGRRVIDAPRVSREVAEAWAAIVRRVAKTTDRTDTTPTDSVSVSSVSVFRGTQIALTPAASQLLTELQEQIEPRLGPARDLHSIADWAGRHHGRVARIAGLLHLCEYSPEELITSSTMRAALRVGDYLLAHGIAALTGPDEKTRRALRWLEKRGEPTVTVRELHRGPVGSQGPVDQAETLAQALEGLGALRALPPGSSGPGRPKSPAYAVNPQLIGGADAVSAEGRTRDERPASGSPSGPSPGLVRDESASLNGHAELATPEQEALYERLTGGES